LALQCVDAEQHDVMDTIRISDMPAHVVHALALCGQSMLLYCVVSMYAAHHSRLSAAERGVEVLLLTLRTRVLRHDFLQCLLNKGASQLEQAIFGGRLPDRLQQAGVLDDDQ
ncbi:MAG: hypothetical protein ACKPKO_18430, partial [Candidatus Fonsibacter sp.]